MTTPGVKLGLVLPPALHERMVAAAGSQSLAATYARAFGELLDRIDAGEPSPSQPSAAVRGA